MSGEFGEMYNRSGFGYFLLSEVADRYRYGDDNRGTNCELTPLLSSVIDIVAEMAKDAAWVEAGDSGDEQGASRIKGRLPELREALRILEARCDQYIKEAAG